MEARVGITLLIIFIVLSGLTIGSYYLFKKISNKEEQIPVPTYKILFKTKDVSGIYLNEPIELVELGDIYETNGSRIGTSYTPIIKLDTRKESYVEVVITNKTKRFNVFCGGNDYYRQSKSIFPSFDSGNIYFFECDFPSDMKKEKEPKLNQLTLLSNSGNVEFEVSARDKLNLKSICFRSETVIIRDVRIDDKNQTSIGEIKNCYGADAIYNTSAQFNVLYNTQGIENYNEITVFLFDEELDYEDLKISDMWVFPLKA